jgi:hypothetical protein
MPAFRLPRILLMLALLLMPLAMAGQGHAVAALPHHQMAASAQEDCHQGKQEQQDERRTDGLAQCMMACAALPAMQAPDAGEAETPRLSLYAPPVAAMRGLAPEATTPPPRTA